MHYLILWEVSHVIPILDLRGGPPYITFVQVCCGCLRLFKTNEPNICLWVTGFLLPVFDHQKVIFLTRPGCNLFSISDLCNSLCMHLYLTKTFITLPQSSIIFYCIFQKYCIFIVFTNFLFVSEPILYKSSLFQIKGN